MPVESATSSARIPIFSSIPSKLNVKQQESRRYIYRQLAAVGLEPRTLGASDRGMYNPLHEVRTLARHCAGGIILGYEQVSAPRVTVWNEKRKRYELSDVDELHSFPTPWNQLETGILFGLSLPLFVLKQDGITGGIFDEGASDVLIYPMPMPDKNWKADDTESQRGTWGAAGFEAALLRWQALVRAQYYNIC